MSIDTRRDRSGFYHAPYVLSQSVKSDIKVYVQKIRSVGGVQVPPGSDAERNSTMGDVCFWLREGAFDIALEKFNQETRGKVECEKGFKVIPKGTTIWQVISWDEEDGSYFPFEIFGSFYRKEDALLSARDEYNYDRNKLAVDAGVGMDRVGLPEAAFVDFTKPQRFRRFI